MKRDLNFESIFLKDLLQKIDEAAMASMIRPTVSDAERNTAIVWHNNGVMVFRDELRLALLGEDEDDG